MARILVGVSGGIAAYKAVELVRLATAAGHSVRVVQTPASLNFVGRATFEGVTGAPVLVEEFDPDPARGAFPGDPESDHSPISHLELVARADVLVVAPASANTLAKLAAGLADNLLTSAALANTAPLVLAPAMNSRMYEHPGQVRLLAVAVLDLPGGDLLEGDLEVVLRAGVHHRRRILVERSLAEVVVVRVDLPGTLGGHQHHGVVGINALEQLVQTWLYHGGHMVAARVASSSTARSRSSFTRW